MANDEVKQCNDVPLRNPKWKQDVQDVQDVQDKEAFVRAYKARLRAMEKVDIDNEASTLQAG